MQSSSGTASGFELLDKYVLVYLALVEEGRFQLFVVEEQLQFGQLLNPLRVQLDLRLDRLVQRVQIVLQLLFEP